MSIQERVHSLAQPLAASLGLVLRTEEVRERTATSRRAAALLSALAPPMSVLLTQGRVADIDNLMGDLGLVAGEDACGREGADRLAFEGLQRDRHHAERGQRIEAGEGILEHDLKLLARLAERLASLDSDAAAMVAVAPPARAQTEEVTYLLPAAAFLPAWRASHLDPVRALRSE